MTAVEYITREEFAQMIRTSVRTLDRLRAKRPEGFPTEFYPAGRPLFRRIEVEAYAASRPLW